MARVFVTGGSGFIGRFLVRTLSAHDCQVTALVRRDPQADGPWPETARPVYGDILEPDAYRREIQAADYVFHLAGCLRSPQPEDFWRVNVGGLESLLKCCADGTKPPRVVVVSSLAAAGPSGNRPRTESDPPQPISNYGRSKLDAERLAADFAHRVPITIVRPPIVLGEGDLMGLKMFTAVARWGVHLHPTLKRTEYSVIHVADLTDLLWRAALSDRIVDADSFCRWERATHVANVRLATNPAGPSHTADDAEQFLGKRPSGSGCQPSVPSLEASASLGLLASQTAGTDPAGVFFAAAEALTYAELGRHIAAALGRRRVLVLPVAAAIIRWAGLAGQWASRVRRRPVYLNADKAREIIAGSWVCSSDKARKQLGFSPQPLTLRLQETIESYRKAGWLR